MPLKQFTGGGGKPRKPRVYKSPASKSKKSSKTSKKGHARKAASATSRRSAAAATFHEQAQTPTGAEHPTTAGLPFTGVGSTAGATPRAVVELTGLNMASGEGLGGAILDLVGEGRLTVAHALAAWTHEQDRLANRAWRRPGGLQRMGGL